jgi:hypothetical protein
MLFALPAAIIATFMDWVLAAKVAYSSPIPLTIPRTSAAIAPAFVPRDTLGAPDAIQVADRFRLLCNLTSAVERSLESRRGQLRGAESPALANQARKTRSDRQKEERRQRRL